MTDTSHLHTPEARAKARAARAKRPSVSLRAAINAKCKDCIYDPLSGGGTWLQQVGACTITTCPLWPVRPGQKHA